VLDRRTLNRTLLARQLLLDRVEMPPLEAVELLVGMQAQVPLDPYVGLWSRLARFDPVGLGRLLLDRELVRMTLLRTTLHLVSASDARAVRPLLQEAIERAFAASPFARNLDGLELEPLLARAVELVEHEPLSTARLGAVLAAEWPGYDPPSLAHAVRYVVPLVQVTPRGVWGKALQPKFTTLDAWLGPGRMSRATLPALVARYLRAFGPASAADVRTWSGLRGIRAVLASVRPALRVYRDESGRELFDVADGVFADPAAPAPVRFLPQYDNLVLAHVDRGRVLAHVRWDGSFLRHGTVFVDGFIAGAWQLRDPKRDALLAIELRTTVGAAERRQVRAEGEELLAFLAPEARTRRLELGPS
jgi:DNA glycosylase AlkZ-like